MKPLPPIPSVLTLAVILSLHSEAQTIIDFKANAAGGSNNWSTNTNWVGDLLPANDTTTNIARFNQTSYANQPAIGIARSIAGIVVGDGTTVTAPLSIGGTQTLTLGASGITTHLNTGTTNISGAPLALAVNQTWNLAAGTSLIIGSQISGATESLALSGDGSLTVGSSTYTGGFTLNSGHVRANATTAFGTGTLTLKSGTLSVSGGSSRTVENSVALNGNIELGATGISGSLNLNGAVDVTGASALTIANTGGVTFANSITLNANLTVHSSLASKVGANTIAAVIKDGSQPHTFTKEGTGLIELSAANTYSGGTLLTSGELWAGNAASFGTGAMTIQSGTLDLRGQNVNLHSLNGSGGAILDTATAGTRTLSVGLGNGSGTYSGTLQQAASNKIIALTKIGTGTQTLSGANTYIGKTTISAGTLLINGSHADASSTTSTVNGFGSLSTGHFEVENGARLGGTGRIAGQTSTGNSNLLLVKSGGGLAPGVGIGTFTLDLNGMKTTGSRSLTMDAGAFFEFDLAGDGSASDKLIFWHYSAGRLSLSNNVIDLTLTGTVAEGSYTATLMEFYSDSGTTVIASGINSGLLLGDLSPNIGSAELVFGTHSIGINYTVIPEPSTYLLLASLTALALLRRRR